MAEHPSVHHKKQAIRHLRHAADDLSGSIERHSRGEHEGALEAAKQAAGHIGEAQSHLGEAARLHAAHERERQGEGSHWNDPDADAP